MEFTPRVIDLKTINGGERYVAGNEVSPEAINAPIEASAYAQEKAYEALTKANMAMEKVEDSEIGQITISAYPIGSIYMSSKPQSPAELFGGYWEKIKGRFLMGSGTPDANTVNKYGELNAESYETFYTGDRGGQFRHTLTKDEMPTHAHGIVRPQYFYDEETTNQSIIGETSTTGRVATGATTDQSGGGQMHNVLNPYYVVNIWKRIA